MARRQQRNFVRSSRPNRDWTGSIPVITIMIPAASKVLLASFALNNPGIDETILRTVGGVAVASDQTAQTENQIGAVGMCLVTDTALAAGIASLPDPVTDFSDDVWFMYQPFAQLTRFNDATGINFNAMTWYPFDSKAKRIMHNGMSLVVVAANASATEGMFVTMIFRMLSQVRGTR